MNPQKQQDAVRASSITETISELDGLREKAIKNGRVLRLEDDTRPSTDYFRALEVAYPALRRAALAGADLAKLINEINMDIECDNAFHSALAKMVSNRWSGQRDIVLAAYRSAIEEKNV